MIEGAVGGVVEFGIEGFVGGGGVGFRGFGVGLIMVELPESFELPTFAARRMRVAAIRGLRTGTLEPADPRVSTYSRHEQAGVVRPEIDGLRDPIADSSATGPQLEPDPEVHKPADSGLAVGNGARICSVEGVSGGVF